MGENPHAPRRTDPDLLRPLLQLREELLALHAVVGEEPLEPLTGRVRACAELVAPLAHAMRLDSTILRQAYDQAVQAKLFWEALLLRIAWAGRAPSPWAATVAERLDRVTHQLRELVLATVAGFPEADAPSGAGSERSNST